MIHNAARAQELVAEAGSLANFFWRFEPQGQGHIEIWSDHCIRPGEAFDPAISTALDSADLVLLLVSADFIHSDYCYSVEVQRALERHQAGSAIVVPIIIRPCDWMSAPFGRRFTSVDMGAMAALTLTQP